MFEWLKLTFSLVLATICLILARKGFNVLVFLVAPKPLTKIRLGKL